jgi:hypothetical protein
LQIHEQREQCVTILAAAQANHDPVALDDHPEIFDRFTHPAKQYFMELFTSIDQGLEALCGQQSVEMKD